MSITSVHTRPSSFSGDSLRQAANVVFACGQVLITLIVFLNGSSSTFSTNTATTATPIVPADYVFSVWALIYGGGLAYAVYQALPAQREQPLLRQIGWYTALGYLGTNLWLISATQRWTWVTVGMFVVILIGILGAFIGFIHYHHPFTRAEQLLVILPISVYAGWGSIALVANISTALQDSGVANPFFPNATWAVIMLVVAGAIAALVTVVSHGNLSYTLTVIWALIGIAVANFTRETSPAVAITAGSLALIMLGVLLRARSGHQERVHMA